MIFYKRFEVGTLYFEGLRIAIVFEYYFQFTIAEEKKGNLLPTISTYFLSLSLFINLTKQT